MPMTSAESIAKSDGGVAALASAPVLMRLMSVSRRFGALAALTDVSFDIRGGEVLGIAGPNGAGKTTLLNVCTGALALSSGEIRVSDRNLAGRRPHIFCRAGVARTFQIPQVFHSMSVGDNVSTGARFALVDKERGADAREAVTEALAATGLTADAELPISRTDLLTRKRVMLAAALATRPQLVFMDEPFAGLNADEVDSFAGLVRDLHARLGITFVVVEHKVRALATLSHRMLILDFGRILKLDTPERVLKDEDVIRIYLGKRNLA